MLRALALLLSLSELASARLLQPPPLHSKLRGGADEKKELTAEEAAAMIPERKALTKEEIMAKMNGCPTFCITNDEGGIVGMTDAQGDKKSVCWFTDAAEAKAICKAMADANPDAGLKLQVHGLGGAFTQCNGWPAEEGSESKTAHSPDGQEIELRVQGNHALVNATADKMKDLLVENGLDPGCWQHPVFLCEKLASPTLMPIFLSPRDLAIVWEKSGRKKEDLPQDITVLELRLLVQQMQTDANPCVSPTLDPSTDGSPLPSLLPPILLLLLRALRLLTQRSADRHRACRSWSIFHFIASPSSIELAAELTGEKLPGEADGAAKPTGADANGDDDVVDDEDDDIVV